MVKIIASNKKLMNFAKWRPKFNSLRKIVKLLNMGKDNNTFMKNYK